MKKYPKVLKFSNYTAKIHRKKDKTHRKNGSFGATNFYSNNLLEQS